MGRSRRIRLPIFIEIWIVGKYEILCCDISNNSFSDVKVSGNPLAWLVACINISVVAIIIVFYFYIGGINFVNNLCP